MSGNHGLTARPCHGDIFPHHAEIPPCKAGHAPRPVQSSREKTDQVTIKIEVAPTGGQHPGTRLKKANIKVALGGDRLYSGSYTADGRTVTVCYGSATKAAQAGWTAVERVARRLLRDLIRENP